MTPSTLPAPPPVFTELVVPPRNCSCPKLGSQNQFISFLYPSYHYAISPISNTRLSLLPPASSISWIRAILAHKTFLFTLVPTISNHESLDTRIKACHFLLKTSQWLSVAHKRKSILLITIHRTVWPGSYLSSNFIPHLATLISMLQLHWLLLCVSGISQSLSEFGICHSSCLEQASLTSSQGSYSSFGSYLKYHLHIGSSYDHLIKCSRQSLSHHLITLVIHILPA